MESAALPLCRSFSSARYQQRTLTRSPADTQLVASLAPAARRPSSQLCSRKVGEGCVGEGEAFQSASHMRRQQGPPRKEGAVRWLLCPAPQTAPGGRWGRERRASSLSTPTFWRLRRVGGREEAQLSRARAASRLVDPREPGPVKAPPRRPFPLLIGWSSPKATRQPPGPRRSYKGGGRMTAAAKLGQLRCSPSRRPRGTSVTLLPLSRPTPPCLGASW